MSFQKVDAGRGVEWLKEAVGIVLKNPAAFLVMGLIVAIGAIIPVLNLVTIIVLPALMAGMAYAAREESQGRKAEIGQLFQGFKEEGRIGPLLMLSLPIIAGMIVSTVLVFVLIGGAIAALSAASGGSGLGAGAGIGGALLGFLLILGVSLAILALILFAVPRVMFDKVEPFTAMKESLAASLANIVPLLILGVILFVVGLVVGVLSIIPLLGILIMLAFGCFVYAMQGALLYVMYRDIFGDNSAAPSGYMPPPAPPMG